MHLQLKIIVPIEVRNNRNKALRQLSYKKMQYFTQQHTGETRKVLFEKHAKDGIMEGYTDNYIKVSTHHRDDWANSIIEWKL